ncbi:MAG: hypothetical protein WD847_20280 [Pirellulales bacterium]
MTPEHENPQTPQTADPRSGPPADAPLSIEEFIERAGGLENARRAIEMLEGLGEAA